MGPSVKKTKASQKKGWTTLMRSSRRPKRKGGEQAVFHAAAMRATEAGIEKAGSSVKKDVIANEEDYREHTMEMAQHNAVAGCGVATKYL